MVYLVSYGLNQSGQNNSSLYQLLETYDCIRDQGLDSVWFINTSQSVDQLRNQIKMVLDANDRLFVTRLFKGCYQGCMDKEIWPWIKNRL